MNIVLLYHSIYSEIPSVRKNFHSVSFENFKKQIEFLNRNYSLDYIDNLIGSKNKKGAYITFDDGYRDLSNKAIPFLENQKIPYTIFWNPGFGQNGFWRDKLRLIISKPYLSKILIKKLNEKYKNYNFNISNVYIKTKGNQINNKLVADICDEILSKNGIRIDCQIMNFKEIYELCKQTNYLRIGNHSLSHFNLKSLNNNELDEELGRSKEIISKLPKSKISNIFSIPFGGTKDIDSNILWQITKKYDYKGILMSRNMLNLNQLLFKKIIFENNIIERFMPKDEGSEEFKKQIKNIMFKTLVKKAISYT